MQYLVRTLAINIWAPSSRDSAKIILYNVAEYYVGGFFTLLFLDIFVLCRLRNVADLDLSSTVTENE